MKFGKKYHSNFIIICKMIRLILTRFWPVLVVLLIYIVIIKIYLKYNKIVNAKFVIIILVTTILCIFWIFLEKKGYKQGIYQPAYFNEQGKLVPAKKVK